MRFYSKVYVKKENRIYKVSSIDFLHRRVMCNEDKPILAPYIDHSTGLLSGACIDYEHNEFDFNEVRFLKPTHDMDTAYSKNIFEGDIIDDGMCIKVCYVTLFGESHTDIMTKTHYVDIKQYDHTFLFNACRLPYEKEEWHTATRHKADIIGNVFTDYKDIVEKGLNENGIDLLQMFNIEEEK